jgi:CPA2 family monovalent cation:H+ antiporter-2
MHSLSLLINISLALIVAFLGGTLARRAGLPTIVGYLLAGMAIGPFTPGFVGDFATIRQLAELGVIFLMFSVGLHFSFRDLWRVRTIVVPGALLHTAVASLLGFWLAQWWGWSTVASLVLGLVISVASTVVLLRILIDNSLLNTSHGQAAVGWLVMEDIFCVLLLILMPSMAASSQELDWGALSVTLLKAAAFAATMFIAGTRLLPWLIERIAHTHSRELFVLAVMTIALGSAIGASELFGVSLALGAFVAGAIISQSHLSHQVGADLFAFREIFTVLFFVSVGMLVDPLFLWQNLGHVAALTFLIVVGKAVAVLPIGMLLPGPARTFLIIALGMGQIGEFSFILAQSGMTVGVLAEDQYALILAAAMISITINPFLFKLLPFLEIALRRFSGFWRHFDRRPLEQRLALPELQEGRFANHVVIVGYGRVGKHMVNILKSLSIPLLVIESDMDRLARLNHRNIPALYGDAGNSGVLDHAHLDRARALVTTVPDESTAMMIVTAARDANPNLQIIARAATEDGVRYLARLGANHVVHPELEGGLELLQHMLLTLDFPLQDVHQYAEAVRRDRYDYAISSVQEHRSLHALMLSLKGIEIIWLTIGAGSPLAGQSLAEANLRARTGASIVALVRDQKLIANPKSMTVFPPGDRIGVIGEKEQVDLVSRLLEEERPPPRPPAELPTLLRSTQRQARRLTGRRRGQPS